MTIASSSTATQSAPPQANVEDVLSAILESPHFTVAEYLNTALYDVIEPKNDSTSITSRSKTPMDHSSAVIHRLTELAVSLQMQTQSSHDTIRRTGMELQTILPRCYNDIQRLQTSYTTLLNECQQLHDDCGAVISGSGSGSTATVGRTSGSSGANNTSKDGTSLPPPPTAAAAATTTSTATTTTDTTVATNSSSSSSSSSSNNNTAAAAAVAMETLGTLHALQTYLHRTKEILIALDVWDTTINAISNYIVQENTTDAVQCLISLQQSEVTLRGMTEQAEQRKSTLQKLQQQVTTLLLQPNLDHALSILPHYNVSGIVATDGISSSTPTTTITPSTPTTSSSTTALAPLQQCVHLYSQLNQFHTLTNQYIKQRPVPIQKLWFDTYHLNIPNEQPQTEHPMIQWLPNYYQQVLHFMNEERRLCEQIFHNQNNNNNNSTNAASAIAIPTILIQIVQECFRTNIVSSFTARLHTIYNPHQHTTAPTSSPAAVAAFPIIATLYESTIQFLSLLYESIVSSYMDMIESSSGSTTNGNAAWQLYQQICTTFMSIVLPFREYQGKQYHTIELQYVQVTMQLNLKAIQQVTKHMNKSNTEMTIEVMQETIDQLQSVATKSIFAILESSLPRYELLNGGYYMMDMIQMMDTNVLNQYMNELSITVHTLSAYIVQNESSHFIKIFEEEHVSIALQILLMMHQLIQSVQQLEHDTGTMIQRLYDRIRNYNNKEERRNMNTTSSFQLSETLSMVEVNTILTKNIAVLALTENNHDEQGETTLQDTISTLQRFVTRTNVPLYYTTVHETMQQKLLLSCHTFIFDVCYAIPRYYLSSIVSYPSWKAASSVTAGVVNEYGTLPQEYMTHIGEHMLALVQALEPFAMNTDNIQQINLNGSIIMNPKYIRRVVQPIWIDVISAIGHTNGIPGNDAALQILMNGTELIDYVLGDVVTIQQDDADVDQNDDDENHKAVTTFCNTWLDVISTAVTGRLIERMLRIPLLTNQGCEHVQADLAYIMNVLTALGIPGHPHPLLGHIATLATLDETVLKERQEAMVSSNSNTETTMSMRLIQSIEQRFIAMRSFG